MYCPCTKPDVISKLNLNAIATVFKELQFENLGNASKMFSF